MTYEMMLEMLEGLGNDVFFDEVEGGFDVTVDDFEGFDDDWSEVERDFDDPEAVESFLDMLEEESLSHEGDFYVVYHFEGFDVELGYTSFDI